MHTIHDAFCEKIVNLTEKMKVGDPLDLQTQIGAISSEAHLRRIQNALHGVGFNCRWFSGDSFETGGYYGPNDCH